tara:strand:+ start:3858 stop:4163 length:306 start_codon:yes stop_codon:yes gene_type:complete
MRIPNQVGVVLLVGVLGLSVSECMGGGSYNSNRRRSNSSGYRGSNLRKHQYQESSRLMDRQKFEAKRWRGSQSELINRMRNQTNRQLRRQHREQHHGHPLY